MKPRLIIAIAMLLVIATAWWVGYRAAGDTASAMAAKGKSKAGRKGPALPAPKIISEAPPTPTPEPTKQTVFHRLQKLMDEGRTKLTLAQVQQYLDDNHRDAESLVTASRITGDLALLREAAAKFPKDPMVLFSLIAKSDRPEERKQAAEAMAAADTTNAMGSYMAAHEAFKSGRTDDAVRYLIEASARPTLDDYAKPLTLAAEQAYLSAGFSALEAKDFADNNLPMLIRPFGELGHQMLDLAKSYEASGDTASAQFIREMGMQCGEESRRSPGGRLWMEFNGLIMESRLLEGMDPNATLGNDGATVKERMERIDAGLQLADKANRFFLNPENQKISPTLLMQFFDRQNAVGEIAAYQWLQGKFDAGAP